MITKKFLNDVQAVLDQIEDRNIDYAFDAIMDKANEDIAGEVARHEDLDY